ncbi:MAG: hypothetical protein EAX89_02370 [Candidatus Lokiarchaeota archaeon]|nr:hypothetical protein [Candidatus Lokiarchaeota archaeon]
MAIINDKVYSKSHPLTEKSEIKFVCPICKTAKSLQFPQFVINQAKQLTTISLPKGLICDHHFQAFVDKNFKVRGYQKVDYEFKFESNIEQKKLDTNQIEKDNSLFDNLILEGNYIEYIPIESKLKEKSNSTDKPNEIQLQDENLKLKEIYDKFWEFIDDNNPKFKDYIERDKRRENIKIIF